MSDDADEDVSIEEIFALFDIDGDGKLTGSELKRFFAGFPGNAAPCLVKFLSEEPVSTSGSFQKRLLSAAAVQKMAWHPGHGPGA